MKPDLGKVRERMVDLEDHHEEEISVEGVMARLLGYDGDPDDVGRAANAECQRVLLLMDTTYRRLGVPKTPMNMVAIGFLQGITFATAFRDVAGDDTGDVAKARALVDLIRSQSKETPSDGVELGISVALLVLDSHHLLRDYPGTPAEYHARVQAAYREALDAMFRTDEDGDA